MTVKEIITNSEPVKSLELFCNKRPQAFERFMRLCESFKNPKTDNVWVLTGTAIQKFTEFAVECPNREALLDSDILSDWLINHLERCRQEKINEGLEVPVR